MVTTKLAGEIRDPEVVRRLLEQRNKNVLNAYATLRKIVERHEATIQKRWLGKTRQARLRILLNAWPGMPLLHRPNLKAYRQIKADKKVVSQWQRMALLWPNINQEDLSKPRPLLLMLNARGRNHPKEFALNDTRHLSLALMSGGVATPAVLDPSYVVKLTGLASDSEYGKLILSKDEAITGEHIPPFGLLVFEIQERLLNFLISVCRFVLHDIPPGPMITDNEAYPVQPEPRLRTESSTGPFRSMAAVAADANYCKPEMFNIDQMVSLLAARSAAAKDRIVALREDPSFFSAVLQTFNEHDITNIKLVNGSANPDRSSTVMWSRAIKHIVSDSYIVNEVYAELYAQACSLRHLTRICASESKSGSTSKPYQEYALAFYRLQLYLEHALKYPLGDLRQLCFASPPLRDMFVVTDVAERAAFTARGKIQAVNIDSNPNYKSPFSACPEKDKAAKVLIWTLTAIWSNDPVVVLAGMPDMVDELQRAMDQENIGAELISPFVASAFGDLSILTHCQQIMDQTYPMYKSPKHVTDAAAKDFDSSFKPYERVPVAMSAENVGDAVPLIDPADGRFAYPVDKRRTKETVEAMRRAEQNLDAFWDAIDGIMYLEAGDLRGTVTQHLLSEHAGIRRTRAWAEPSIAVTAAVAAMSGVHANSGGKKKKGAKKATAASAMAGSADTEPRLQPLSALFRSLYKDKSEAALGSGGPSGSKGSNGTSNGSTASSTGSCYASSDGQALSDGASGPSIRVNPRALKVFRAIFFNPDGNSTFGEVAWDDFVYAMSSIGFQAEKMYGSLWHFRPTKQGVAGVSSSTGSSIQFHDPFPQSKVSFEAARQIGRRLTRAYGWTRDTFVANKSK